jgi:hypothetical protein
MHCVANTLKQLKSESRLKMIDPDLRLGVVGLGPLRRQGVDVVRGGPPSWTKPKLPEAQERMFENLPASAKTVAETQLPWFLLVFRASRRMARPAETYPRDPPFAGMPEDIEKPREPRSLQV